MKELRYNLSSEVRQKWVGRTDGHGANQRCISIVASQTSHAPTSKGTRINLSRIDDSVRSVKPVQPTRASQPLTTKWFENNLGGIRSCKPWLRPGDRRYSSFLWRLMCTKGTVPLIFPPTNPTRSRYYLNAGGMIF